VIAHESIGGDPDTGPGAGILFRAVERPDVSHQLSVAVLDQGGGIAMPRCHDVMAASRHDLEVGHEIAAQDLAELQAVLAAGHGAPVEELVAVGVLSADG
jgi:hypothetical protein